LGKRRDLERIDICRTFRTRRWAISRVH